MKPKLKKSRPVKRAPAPDELGAHEKDVTYRGKKYRLRVHEKMGDDGVIETHMDYDSHAAPKREKLKPNVQYDAATRTWMRYDYKKERWVKDTRKGKGFK